MARTTNTAGDAQAVANDSQRARSARPARTAFKALLLADPDLAHRFNRVRRYSASIRASEYHITNACNIRCKGCWFFQHEFDLQTRDERDLGKLKAFIDKERERGVNAALLIGGEPTLYPDRIATYVENMEHVTISTNGMKPFPYAGFEQVNVAISLFGGGALDDEIRGIRPSGSRFTGLFDSALRSHRYDPRAIFIYAITEDGVDYIEETVRRIADNGNTVNFSFYSKYDQDEPLGIADVNRLRDEAHRVKDLYPNTVVSTQFYIDVMISGRTEWGTFGYDVCPSISQDHPAHKERLRNGNRTLPLFNAYAPDLETVHFCCTSGHCSDCRDSQAVFSWLMISAPKFMTSIDNLRVWVDLAESYWSQFVWSPFHRSQTMLQADAPGPSAEAA